jgi:hypothetical protein
MSVNIEPVNVQLRSEAMLCHTISNVTPQIQINCNYFNSIIMHHYWICSEQQKWNMFFHASVCSSPFCSEYFRLFSAKVDPVSGLLQSVILNVFAL